MTDTAHVADAHDEVDPLLLAVFEDMNRARGASRPVGEPRQSTLAEGLLVSALAGNPSLAPLARGLVRFGDFYSRAHGLIFHAVCRLHEQGRPIDEVGVTEVLRRAKVLRAAGDEQAIIDTFAAGSICAGNVTAAHEVETHAKRIAEYAAARRIGQAAHELAARAQDWSIPVATLVSTARSIEADAARSAPTAPALASDAAAWVERFEARADGTESAGLSTGYRSLDDVLLGLRGGQLLLLAARPSMGKTAMSLCIALRVAHGGTPVLFVSLEMTRDELMGRAVSVTSRIPYSLILRPPLDLDAVDRNRIGVTARQLARVPLFVSDPPSLTIDELCAHVRAEHARRGVGLVIVDYAQLVKPAKPHESREREVREVADGLKALAKSLNVPVLALAQLNRDVERKQREPVLSDLRESGALEQNADVVMFLHSDEDPGAAALKGAMTPRDVDVIFRKVRSGARDVKATLRWVPGVVTYSDDGDDYGGMTARGGDAE